MSSFIRKRVRGLLRQTFSGPNSTDNDSPTTDEFGIGLSEECPPGPISGRKTSQNSSSIIYERILNGRNGRKVELPEIYAGKTGLDLPVIQLAEFSTAVRSCYTGPDGGLTRVQQMRQQPIVRMANLDDELSLSMDGDDFSGDEEEEESMGREPWSAGQTASETTRMNTSLGMASTSSMEALGFTAGDLLPGTSTNRLSWTTFDEMRSFGLSTSLYEKHPITGLNAGTPIADVFAIIARENNAILALADGVNWGEGARLAARCAIRGAVDHLNTAIESGHCGTTTEVFHCLLGAFHAGHALILQEGGALTTLCVALVAPVRNSNSFVLCVCNVGDSLCFVHSPTYGVREVTLASHDIAQMRDMRDAGGALGPVDGRNPQLHNLTCSMTFVEEGEIVFITSDGVSDNFDPVVGRFCVIKKTESEKENLPSPQEENPPKPVPAPFHKSRSVPVNNALPVIRPKRCTATLPCVDAFERHELMLLRMADVISNGMNSNQTPRPTFSLRDGEQCSSPYAISEEKTATGGSVSPSSAEECNARSASELCKNLIHFATQLSNAKRKTLEDPELYRTRTHSKTEERLRRKMIRNMIMEMPGKLDHASVVAFRVGQWGDNIPTLSRPMRSSTPETPKAEMTNVTLASNGCTEETGKTNRTTKAHPLEETFCAAKLCKHPCQADTSHQVVQGDRTSLTHNVTRRNMPIELQNVEVYRSPTHIRRSPYEDQPLSFEVAVRPLVTMENLANGPQKAFDDSAPCVKPRAHKAKRHRRGSIARHTLGVDVAWLKRLVTNKHSSESQPHSDAPIVTEPQSPSSPTTSSSPSQMRMPSSSYGQNSERITTLRRTEQTTASPAESNTRNFSLKKLRGLIRSNLTPNVAREENLVVRRERSPSASSKRLSQPPNMRAQPIFTKISTRV